MWLFLQKTFNLKTLAGVQTFVIILVLVYAWTNHERLKTQRTELDTARAALEHPATIEKIKTVTVQGPVRVITKIVERSTGEKETTIDETREPVIETNQAESESKPVSLESILPRARTDRWLVGADLRSWSPSTIEAYTFYGGYSFKNRVDVMLGGGRPDKFEGHLLVVARF